MTEVSKPIDKALNIGAALKIIWLALFLIVQFSQNLFLPHLSKFMNGNNYETEAYINIPMIACAILTVGMYILFWYLMKMQCRQRNTSLVLVGVISLIGIFAIAPICSTVANVFSIRLASLQGISAITSSNLMNIVINYLSSINGAANLLFVAAFAMLCYRNRFVPET